MRDEPELTPREAQALAAGAVAHWLEQLLVTLDQAEQVLASITADQAIGGVRQLVPLIKLARNEQRELADNLADTNYDLAR